MSRRKSARSVSAWREGRRFVGLCIDCGADTSARGTLLCAECQQRNTIAARRRKADLESEGLCTRCGTRPREDGKKSCAECNDIRRTEYRLSRSYGVPTNTRSRRAERANGSPLECGYCGCNLVHATRRFRPDNAAEIDHIVPVSRGGGDDPKNLQWLCKKCNRSKGVMTDAEYRRAKCLPPYEFLKDISANKLSMLSQSVSMGGE
jgi:5-methylcytosine-specific restriction endonuclease McrA